MIGFRMEPPVTCAGWETMDKLMKYFVLPLSLVCSTASLADKWAPIDRTQKYRLGGLDCVLKEKTPPDKRFELESEFTCSKDGKVTFAKKGFGATTLVAAPDGKHILGLSSSGLHPYAFWIIDSMGNAVASANHGSPGIKYCQQTMSLVRVWFADKHEAKFEVVDGRLVDVSIKACTGNTIGLAGVSKFTSK